MNHHTTADFWDCYGRLPETVQRLADAKYDLLRADPWHPSLHFIRQRVFGFNWLDHPAPTPEMLEQAV